MASLATGEFSCFCCMNTSVGVWGRCTRSSNVTGSIIAMAKLLRRSLAILSSTAIHCLVWPEVVVSCALGMGTQRGGICAVDQQRNSGGFSSTSVFPGHGKWWRFNLRVTLLVVQETLRRRPREQSPHLVIQDSLGLRSPALAHSRPDRACQRSWQP